MKTYPQSALTALVIALFATESAIASDSSWQAIDNHHGAYIYSARPLQTGTTIAFGGHGKGVGRTVKRTNSSPNEPKSGFREVTTPHGTVNYFAPAD